MSARRFATAKEGMNRRKRTTVDGHKFDSTAEARRYGELNLLQQAGKIRRLRVHPRFNLKVNGVKVCAYVADFDYIDVENGNRYVVEDCKPRDFATRESRLKMKLFLAVYGTPVTVVER
jgi:hypothetical protein